MVVLKNEEGKSHATKFLSYNNVIEDVKRIANYIITQYHNNGSFNRVDIVSLNTGNVFQNVVFGTKITRDGSVEDQPKDDKTDIFNNTWKSLKWIKRNMKLTQQGNKQLFNLCNRTGPLPGPCVDSSSLRGPWFGVLTPSPHETHRDNHAS